MRTTKLLAIAAAILLFATACRMPSQDKTSEASPHNEADVAFAEMMIPHHQQAVEMTKLAADRSDSQEVKDLAAAIEAVQGPEIQTMQGWLAAHGKAR